MNTTHRFAPRSTAAAVLLSVACLLLPDAEAQAQSAEAQSEPLQAGVAAGVRGTVQLSRAYDGTVGKRLDSGAAIFLDDVIKAGPDSTMQILLLDQTTFTIGANSEIVIDSFVYDPETNVGKISAQILKGAFRFTTGLVGQNDPDSVSIGTPLGTIGIRGTIVAGDVNPDSALIVLIGPGDEAGTKERIGRIAVSNGQGTVDISRSGYGTTLTALEPPTTPVQVPETRIAGIFASLQGEAPQAAEGEQEPAPAATAKEDDGGDGDAESEGEAGNSDQKSDGKSAPQQAATKTPGSTPAKSAPNAAPAAAPATAPRAASAAPTPVAVAAAPLTGSIGGVSVANLSGATVLQGVSAAVGTETVTNAENQDSDTVEEVATAASSTLGEVTTLADLASITTGSAVLSNTGTLTGTAGSTGTFNFTGTVNFGAQTAQFSLNASWSGTNNGSFSISAGPETLTQIFTDNGRSPGSDATFDSIGGTDLEGFNSTNSNDNLSGLAANETATVDLRIRNGGNTVAAFMDVEVKVTDNSGAETLTGSATAAR